MFSVFINFCDLCLHKLTQLEKSEMEPWTDVVHQEMRLYAILF